MFTEPNHRSLHFPNKLFIWKPVCKNVFNCTKGREYFFLLLSKHDIFKWNGMFTLIHYWILFSSEIKFIQLLLTFAEQFAGLLQYIENGYIWSTSFLSCIYTNPVVPYAIKSDIEVLSCNSRHTCTKQSKIQNPLSEESLCQCLCW